MIECEDKSAPLQIKTHPSSPGGGTQIYVATKKRVLTHHKPRDSELSDNPAYQQEAARGLEGDQQLLISHANHRLFPRSLGPDH